MGQRFRSLVELQNSISLENFDVLPSDSRSSCAYCGLDIFELLYKNDNEAFIRCNLCNSLWVISSETLLCVD